MEGIKGMNRLFFFNGSAKGEKIGKIPSGVVCTEPRIIPDLSQTWKMCQKKGKHTRCDGGSELSGRRCQLEPKCEGQHVTLRKCAAPWENYMSAVTHTSRKARNMCVNNSCWRRMLKETYIGMSGNVLIWARQTDTLHSDLQSG